MLQVQSSISHTFAEGATTWVSDNDKDAWLRVVEGNHIDLLADALQAWYRSCCHALAQPDCIVEATADLMSSTLDALEMFRLAFLNLPHHAALDACASLWYFFKTEYQHEVADHLVRLACDSASWTRFLVDPSLQTLASAVGVCQDAYHRCESVSDRRRGEQGGKRTDVDSASSRGPTAADLATEVGVSADTFARVRKAAKIEVNMKGSAARDRRYTPEEVDRLISAARNGSFLERKRMIERWAKWASRSAKGGPPSPHVSRK